MSDADGRSESTIQPPLLLTTSACPPQQRPAGVVPAFRPPQPPSSAPSTRALLSTALKKAQVAVNLDGENKLIDAVRAYKEATRLLSIVLERTESEESRKKLLQIVCH